jgi:hypothetical protein
MGHAWRSGHDALLAPPVPPDDPPLSTSTACLALGAPLHPPDPAAWWLAPPGGPLRASVTMCHAPRGDPPPPHAATTTCSTHAPMA